MPKAHQTKLAVLHTLHIFGHTLDRTDLIEHAQDRFIRAAVQGAVERGGCARDRRERIGVRAADGAHRVSRTVLFMVCVQDEEDCERAFEYRIRFIFQLGRLEHHVQKVALVREIIVGIGIRQTDAVAIGERGNGRHFGDQTINLFLSALDIENLFRVWIKRRKRGDH